MTSRFSSSDACIFFSRKKLLLRAVRIQMRIVAKRIAKEDIRGFPLGVLDGSRVPSAVRCINNVLDKRPPPWLGGLLRTQDRHPIEVPTVVAEYNGSDRSIAEQCLTKRPIAPMRYNQSEITMAQECLA